MALSSVEMGIVVRALDRAPSVHNTQPWELVVVGQGLELHERADLQLPRHDPTGRDRLLSCGAALANLDLAVRALGHGAEVTVLPSADRPHLVASLRITDTGEADTARYAAIFRRRSYRAPFALHDPAPRLLRRLAASATTAEADVHVVRRGDETKAMADLLCYAGGVLRDDRAYQRELSAWTTQFPNPPEPGAALPWAGLVQTDTHVPDRVSLYNRLSSEAMLVVHTATDTRCDHVLAGLALQRLWLAVIAHGLVASVLTQPLQLAEVRLGFGTRLHLPGKPQALLRTGYPVTGLPVGAVPPGAYEKVVP